MKAAEQYFHVVMLIMLYKVVLSFKSMEETLVCDHSNKATEQYFHVILYKRLLTSYFGWKSCWGQCFRGHCLFLLSTCIYKMDVQATYFNTVSQMSQHTISIGMPGNMGSNAIFWLIFVWSVKHPVWLRLTVWFHSTKEKSKSEKTTTTKLNLKTYSGILKSVGLV